MSDDIKECSYTNAVNGEKGASDSRDAQVRLCGTKDRMKVGIARYFPPTGSGKPLSVEGMREALQATGVQVSLDEGKAREAIRCLENGESVEKIVIARGQAPQEPRDGSFALLGTEPHCPVFPEQSFGQYSLPVFSASGFRIDGQELLPENSSPPWSLHISPDNGCRLVEETGRVVSLRYGFVVVGEERLSVAPAFSVAQDGLTVSGTLSSVDIEGNDISSEDILSVLADMNIHADLIEIQAIEDALEQSRQTGKFSEDIVVASGRKPVHGKNGWVEVLMVTSDCIGGGCGEEGRVDYRERGFAPTVKEGEEAARLHPPTSGVNGVDVYGNTLVAKDGKVATCTLDKTVAINEEQTHIIAQVPGLVHFLNGVLSIKDVMVVQGDVDYSTGNVKVATGSIQVEGTVLTGFSVKTPETLQVREIIEGANVIAGGDVEVGGGIIMANEGHIRCGGKVSAEFITEADIATRGDVVVNKSIQHSHIQAGGSVTVLGKGVIHGGAIISSKGIYAVEAGSDLDVETHLVITTRTHEEETLAKNKKKLKEKLAKLIHLLGEGSDEQVLMHADAENYRTIEKALAMRAELSASLEALRIRGREIHAARHSRLAKARITIRGTTHPKTVITMGEASFRVSSPLIAAEFTYDPISHEIVASSAS